jgi:hypothetical protein
VNLAAQAITLIAVVVGAITSFIATSINDRRRYRQSQSDRWADKKLEAYAAYLESVKEMRQVSRRVAAARGVGQHAHQLLPDDGLPALADAEAVRANASERVTLLGGSATVAAIRQLNSEVWRLEWIARDKLLPNGAEWEECNQSLVRTLNLVHEEIRAELQIPGKFLPRTIGEPDVPSLPIVSFAQRETSAQSQQPASLLMAVKDDHMQRDAVVDHLPQHCAANIRDLLSQRRMRWARGAAGCCSYSRHRGSVSLVGRPRHG